MAGKVSQFDFSIVKGQFAILTAEVTMAKNDSQRKGGSTMVM